MEEKELQALLDKVDGKITEGMKAVTAGLLKAEDFEAKLTEMRVNDLTIKEVVEAVTKQGDQITKLIQERETPTKRESLNELVKRVHPDVVKALASGGSHKFSMNTNKTAVALTAITSDPMGMMIPGVAEIQSQKNMIVPSLNSFNIGADSHGIIYWTDQTTRTNNAAARSDGSAAAEQVYAWTGYSETIDNVSAMIPVHKEALKHISFMEGELKRLLSDDCLTALDAYAYTGSGTAPQIGGIYTRSTAFDAAAYVAAGGYTPIKTGIYDLVLSMAMQIEKATKYMVDKVWLNPYDVGRLRLAKDVNGSFLFPQYALGNGGDLYIGKIKVIEANSVTVNTCVVGDSRKATMYTSGNVEIEIGYDLTGDFSKRILTILANMEASLLIRNAEVDAFLKSTNITTDIAGIEYSGS
jgi:hypothetical protein